MTRNVYSFRIAYQSEEEMQNLEAVDPNKLVLTILPNGQPSFKTLYAICETEEEALRRVDAFVQKTKYCDLPDGKVI